MTNYLNVVVVANDDDDNNNDNDENDDNDDVHISTFIVTKTKMQEVNLLTEGEHIDTNRQVRHQRDH